MKMEIDTDDNIDIVDITNIFWSVVNNIVSLVYDDLIETSSFKELSTYVNEDYVYVLYLRDLGLKTYPKDLNDMFYDTVRYYRNIAPQSNNCILLENALKKIDNYIQIDCDISDMLNSSFFAK